jgi:hypothetical protein
MLRRIYTVIAAAAMLVFSALPVSAATMSSSTMSSSTHKISFPSLHGVDAWGGFTKTGTKVRVSVCAGVAGHGVPAVAAVAEDSNANNSKSSRFAALAIGYHQGSCATENLLYTNHLRVYTYILSSHGKISAQSKTKTIW